MRWTSIVAIYTLFWVLAAFVVAWVVSLAVDERRAAELMRLHEQHLRQFGTVRVALGMHALHLAADDPERKRVVKMYESLRVRGPRCRAGWCGGAVTRRGWVRVCRCVPCVRCVPP